MSEKAKKAINFDLDTNALKEHFDDIRKPYSLIKNFMLENGFEHKQYSGYVSIEELDDKDIADFIEKIGDKFKWLEDTMREFNVTDIPQEQYSIKELITNVIRKEQKISSNEKIETEIETETNKPSKPKIRRI